LSNEVRHNFLSRLQYFGFFWLFCPLYIGSIMHHVAQLTYQHVSRRNVAQHCCQHFVIQCLLNCLLIVIIQI